MKNYDMGRKVVGYILMENTGSFAPQQITRTNDNGIESIRFYTKLQSFNVKNRNGRVYEGAAMLEGLDAPHIQELIKRKSWVGEAGHPDTDDNIRRILTYDNTRLSHKILSIDKTNNGVHGWVQTLPTRYGKEFELLVLQGMEAAFSLRALAPLTKMPDGTVVVKSRPHIVCYDWVVLPSHPDAYQDMSKPIERVIKEINTGGSVTVEGFKPITESSILDYIAEDSFNVKSVMESYGMTSTNIAQVTSNLKNVLLKSNGNTYSVSLESYISKDISRYIADKL